MFLDTVSDLLLHQGASAVDVVAPDATVADAVRLMNRKRARAVLVVNGAGLEGILTGRDVLQKIVEPGLDAAHTAVRAAMTVRPKTVRPYEPAARARDLMLRGGFRHLPVVDGGTVRGVLSMGDLNDWLTRTLRTQAGGALMAVKSMGMSNRCR